MSLSHDRGVFRTTLTLDGLDLYEKAEGRVNDAQTTWLSLDLAWIPLDWFVGANVGAHLVLADFEQTSFGSRDALVESSVSLITRLGPKWSSPITLRVGYIHLLGVASHGHGLTVGLDATLF